MDAVILFLVGVFVGSVNSIAGGGMLVGFPVLMAFGLPPVVANATGKTVVLPGQLAATFGYRRFFRTIPRRYALLSIPALAGSALGAELLLRTRNHFEHVAPYLILAAVALFLMEPVIHRYLEKRHSRHTTLPLWAVGVFLFVVTVYGGYFGAGLGMLLLAFLSFSDLRSIHHMNLVKSLSGATAVIMTIVLLASGSLIAWYHGVFMGIGSAVGAYATSRLAPEIPPIVIRSIVVFCGCATAIYFFL